MNVIDLKFIASCFPEFHHRHSHHHHCHWSTSLRFSCFYAKLHATLLFFIFFLLLVRLFLLLLNRLSAARFWRIQSIDAVFFYSNPFVSFPFLPTFNAIVPLIITSDVSGNNTTQNMNLEMVCDVQQIVECFWYFCLVRSLICFNFATHQQSVITRPRLSTRYRDGKWGNTVQWETE